MGQNDTKPINSVPRVEGQLFEISLDSKFKNWVHARLSRDHGDQLYFVYCEVDEKGLITYREIRLFNNDLRRIAAIGTHLPVINGPEIPMDICTIYNKEINTLPVVGTSKRPKLVLHPPIPARLRAPESIRWPKAMVKCPCIYCKGHLKELN